MRLRFRLECGLGAELMLGLRHRLGQEWALGVGRGFRLRCWLRGSCFGAEQKLRLCHRIGVERGLRAEEGPWLRLSDWFGVELRPRFGLERGLRVELWFGL